MMSIRHLVKRVVPGVVRRRMSAMRSARALYRFYFRHRVEAIYPTILSTGETHNFTYDLTEKSIRYLAETIALVTDSTEEEIEAYIEEAVADKDINARVIAETGNARLNVTSLFGRRLGWYAVARALKPRVIVETGVERGHGALILCAALLRNGVDGSSGRYYGTDINPNAGQLLKGKYAEVGRILYGDSIASLKAFDQTIDLFINDSDHSADYEYLEYRTVADRLSAQAIILGDNAHVTDKLALFSRETGRHFLFFHEEPKGHWYPGCGIGFSFAKNCAKRPC